MLAAHRRATVNALNDRRAACRFLADRTGARCSNALVNSTTLAKSLIDLLINGRQRAGGQCIADRHAFERVAPVVKRPRINAAQVTLRVVTRERRTAKKYRDVDAALVEFAQILFHHSHAAHKQSAHAQRVGLGSLHCFQHRRQRLLDANIVNFKSIVGENDVNQVLANVMNIAGNRRQHNPCFGTTGGASFLHMRLQQGNCLLHHRGTLQNERQLHLAGTEEITNYFHADEQMVVDDFQRSIHRQCAIKRRFNTLVFAVNDVLLKRLFNRKIRKCLAYLDRLSPIGEQPNEVQQRVKVFRHPFRTLRTTTIKDQPLRSIPLFLGNAILWKDLARMHNRRGQPTRARFM